MIEDHNWQVGEKVFVETSGYGSRKWIDTVTSITKSGKIKVGDSLFRPDGHQYGGDHWHWTDISPCSPEDEAAFKKEVARLNTAEILKNWDWKRVDFDMMQKIINMLPKG